MPNRIIKESICESEGLAECSLFSADLYKRLITYADDYGRFNSDTKIMRARLFPREYEEVTEEDIIHSLAELAGVGKLFFYTAKHFGQGEKRSGVYGAFPNWGEHQRVRDSKTKCPDPGDTEVNDWYLRRFIPMDLKVEIIERDGFKCKICGKFLTSCRDARRFAKLGQGLYHIDHIVPVVQGGRATEENLRLACPECNQKRKKRFSFREILDFSNGDDFAATCGELRQNAALIQSNPNPNPNPNNSIADTDVGKPTKHKYGSYSNVLLTDEEYQKLVEEFPTDYQTRIERLSEYMASTWKKYKCHLATIRSWSRNERSTPVAKNKVPMGATGQLGQAELDNIKRLMEES